MSIGGFAMVETFVQSTDDVVKFLTDQHNLIKDMFDEVLSATDTRRARRRSSNAPTAGRARDRRGDGRPSACAPRGGQGRRNRRRPPEGGARAKQMLSKLEGMDVGSQKFIDELTKFRDAVIEHAEHEENEEFTCWSAISRQMTASGWQRPSWPRRPSHHPAPCGRGVGQDEFRCRSVRIDAGQARDAISAALH